MKIANPFYQPGTKIKRAAQKVVKFAGKAIGLESFGFSEIQLGIIRESIGVDNPFETVWIANVCGLLLSMNAAAIPTRLEDREGEPVDDKGKQGTAGPLAKYNLLTRQPNFLYSGFDFMEMQTLNRMFHGNAYTRAIGTGGNVKENPKELWPLFAGSVEPTTNGKPVTPDTLVFEDSSSGTKETWNYNEIIHVKEPNMKSHIEGLPWTVAASGKMKQILQLEQYQVNIFQNGAYPAINMHTDQDMSPEQREEYKEDFQKHQAGLEHAGAVLITANGLKASSMAFNPADMEVLAAERLALSIAATIFKTPAELLGPLMQQKNVATYREAVKQYYEATLIPVAEKHYLEHSRAFWPNGEFEIKVNLSAIAAIRPPTEELVNAYWFTPNQKRIMQGAPATDDPFMDKFYLPTSLAAIEDIGAEMAENNEEL